MFIWIGKRIDVAFTTTANFRSSFTSDQHITVSLRFCRILLPAVSATELEFVSIHMCSISCPVLPTPSAFDNLFEVSLSCASLDWPRITEHVEYKLLSLTYKVLTTIQPSYLHNLISVQSTRSTRSSALVTLTRPSTSSSLWITDRSFQYASPCLWNQLPATLRQPRTNLSNSDSSILHLPPHFPLSTHHCHHPPFLRFSLQAQNLPGHTVHYKVV